MSTIDDGRAAVREIAIRDWTKFGSTIKAERKRAGLSQQELAARAGTSRSWIAKVEGGHRGAEFEQMLKLLEALELTMVLRSEADVEAGGDPTTTRISLKLSEVEAAGLKTWHRKLQSGRRTAWATVGTRASSDGNGGGSDG